MHFIADIHLHSRFARATSRDLNPSNLHTWSALKGIGVVGTGDFTHPQWYNELNAQLEPAEPGLYRLKQPWRGAVEASLPPACRHPVRFLLTVEISNIYKKNGRTRKIHNLVILPSLDAVDALNKRLGAIGNLTSDGRPILGLDSRDLLEICLEVCPEVLFIPAHIWTPHFAVLGAASGFDSLEECYEDLLPHIFAVETGLSSDPPMNWRLSALDRYAIVSNSDAHSPQKLGREATLFNADLSYQGIYNALKTNDPEQFTSTLEFYPEEGKYHYDGHRKCNIRWKPAQTLAAQGICPECGRPLTVGVLHRVEKLADRPEGFCPPNARPHEYIIPLPEIIGAAIGVGPNSKKVQGMYHQLLAALGPEFGILRHADPQAIARMDQPLVAEGIRRMRAGTIDIKPGYDGEFGTIQVFTPDQRQALMGQTALFDLPAQQTPDAPKKSRRAPAPAATSDTAVPDGPPLSTTDQAQEQAVSALIGPVIVAAGPGSGKTRTLTRRIAAVLKDGTVQPKQILAVTFTKRAAAEMRQRLRDLLKDTTHIDDLTVGTFHRIALDLSAQYGTAPPKILLDEWESRDVLAQAIRQAASTQKINTKKIKINTVQTTLSLYKAAGIPAHEVSDPNLRPIYRTYQALLATHNAADYDDILLDFLTLLNTNAAVLNAIQQRFAHLLVDEFQDVNAVQYQLVTLLAGNGNGLFVIGDPDQAIYRFRGAEPRYFQQLATDFPQAQVIQLTRNYRSTAYITQAATAVISHNPDRPPKQPAQPVRPAGGPVRLLTVPGETAEGIAVVREISRQIGGTDMQQTDRQQGPATPRSWNDFAVLFRTGAQAEALEACFIQEGLPYRLLGQKGFLETQSVRHALAFCRYLLNPSDALRLLQVMGQTPFHPGDEALNACQEQCRRTPEFGSLNALVAQLPAALESQFQPLIKNVERYQKHQAADGPQALLQMWQQDHGLEEDPDFSRLLGLAAQTARLDQLLDTLLIGGDGDYERWGQTTTHTAERVSLMTLHAAKGLEFPVVFICGVEDGLLPLRRGDSVDLAEERRLFYVGLTRAQDEAILLHTRHRSRYGQRHATKPSLFLKEIPASMLDHTQIELPRPKETGQLSLF